MLLQLIIRSQNNSSYTANTLHCMIFKTFSQHILTPTRKTYAYSANSVELTMRHLCFVFLKCGSGKRKNILLSCKKINLCVKYVLLYTVCKNTACLTVVSWFKVYSLDQSVNQISIASISPVKPGPMA